MRKLLITGGTGFIGKNLKEKLINKYEIYAPIRQELDLTNTESVRLYLKEHKFDTVIHCANTNTGRVNKEVRGNDQILYMNLKMYWNLACCEDLYGRMYYLGSGAEFDMRHYISDMTEDYFGNHIPDDAYGFSKYIMNQDARKSENIYNLRLFGVYGKYEEWNRRFISNNMCRILRGLNISINQDMEFDYLYIDDLCQIMIWFIEHTPKFHDYNVCTGKAVRLSEIAEIIGKECGRKSSIHILNEGEKLPYTADNSRLLKELGKWNFTDIFKGIELLWEYYCDMYNRDEQFRNQLNAYAFI